MAKCSENESLLSLKGTKYFAQDNSDYFTPFFFFVPAEVTQFWVMKAETNSSGTFLGNYFLAVKSSTNKESPFSFLDIFIFSFVYAQNRHAKILKTGSINKLGIAQQMNEEMSSRVVDVLLNYPNLN